MAAPLTSPRTRARCETANTIATGSAAISVASASVGRDDLKMSDSPTWIGELPVVRQERVGKEEVVPIGDEAEEEDQGDDRSREWDAKAPERGPFATSVDSRCVQEFRRYRGRVVDVSEVDAEREEREGQDHRKDASDQMDGVELEEDRKHERRRWDEHRDEGKCQDQLAPPESRLPKGLTPGLIGGSRPQPVGCSRPLDQAG